MGFEIYFPSDLKPKLDRSFVAFTSEENLYGFGRWYDGHSERLVIKRGEEWDITIIKATEYHHIESLCSKDSYYQCLAKRFMNLDYKTMRTSPIDCTKEHSWDSIETIRGRT